MSSEAFIIVAAWGASVLVSVTVSQEMARRRKRDAELWLLLAAFIGPFAMLALHLLGERTPPTRAEVARNARIGSIVSTALAVLLVLVLAVPLIRGCFRI